MKYFYHYTTEEKWARIQEEGLRPEGTIDNLHRRNLPDLAYAPVTFGLASHAPANWLSYPVLNPEYPPMAALERLLRYVGQDEENSLVLLKIRITPEDDIRVGDYDKVMSVANEISQKVSTDTERSKYFAKAPVYRHAIQEYCGSVTNLRDKFSAVADKKLPEILCFNTIPPERIECVKKISDAEAKIHSYVSQKMKRIGLT